MAAIGRSLLLEDDEESRLLGVAMLMHLPSRLREAQPYLAGVALAESAGALDAMGLGPEADRVRGEFRRQFPGHPMLGSGQGASRGAVRGRGASEGAD